MAEFSSFETGFYVNFYVLFYKFSVYIGVLGYFCLGRAIAEA